MKRLLAMLLCLSLVDGMDGTLDAAAPPTGPLATVLMRFDSLNK